MMIWFRDIIKFICHISLSVCLCIISNLLFVTWMVVDSQIFRFQIYKKKSVFRQMIFDLVFFLVFLVQVMLLLLLLGISRHFVTKEKLVNLFIIVVHCCPSTNTQQQQQQQQLQNVLACQLSSFLFFGHPPKNQTKSKKKENSFDLNVHFVSFYQSLYSVVVIVVSHYYHYH